MGLAGLFWLQALTLHCCRRSMQKMGKLGRVRVQATGESEVRGLRRVPSPVPWHGQTAPLAPLPC